MGLPEYFLNRIKCLHKIILIALAYLIIAIPLPSKATSLQANLPRLIAESLKEDPKNLQQFIYNPKWLSAPPVEIIRTTKDAALKPAFNTVVRAMYSKKYLYLLYSAPYTELTTFDSQQGERDQLWTKDVVEIFIGSSDFDTHNNFYHYHEFELAPNKDWVALTVQYNKKTEKFTSLVDWHSKFARAVQVDAKEKIWYGLMRIPLTEIDPYPLKRTTIWHVNLFRFDAKNNLYLAWNPSLSNSFHIPQQFGYLVRN